MNRSKLYINAVIVFWVIILVTYRLLVSFSYKCELSNGETNNVWKAINVAQGKSLYNDPEDLPLDVFQYTPISEFPIILFAKVLNNHSANYVYWITVLGRLYELGCNVLLGLILYRIAAKLLCLNKINAILVGLTAISILTTTAFTIRPDATALLFIFLIVYFYGKTIENDFQIKWLLLLSVFFIVNFFSKQDGIFIAIPIGIHMLLHKKWNVFFITVSISLLLLLSVFFIIYLISGDYFFINTILGLKNTTSVHQMISVFDRAFSFYGFFISIGLILSLKYCFQFKDKKHHFLGVISVFYFLLALAISTKIGSWINYYTPFVILSTILIMVYFEDKLFNKNQFHLVRYCFMLFSFIFLFRQLYTYTYPFIDVSDANKKIYTSNYESYKRIKKTYNIKKNDKVITTDYLMRNFFASNSVMVNMEYYNQASYKYADFKAAKNKLIKCIIFKKSEKSTIHFLSNYFNINLKDYELSSTKSFSILSLKS